MFNMDNISNILVSKKAELLHLYIAVVSIVMLVSNSVPNVLGRACHFVALSKGLNINE